MDVYDMANRLSSEIRQSEEYKNYKEAKEKIKQNVDKKNKLDEFEKLRYKNQLNSIQAKESDKLEVEKMKEQYVELIKDDEIKKYFDCEIKFNVMLTDVNKIIAESVQDLL